MMVNWGGSRGGGGSGIRTRDGVAPIHALQACAFNRSATPPEGPAYGPRRDSSRAPRGAQRGPDTSLPRRNTAGGSPLWSGGSGDGMASPVAATRSGRVLKDPTAVEPPRCGTARNDGAAARCARHAIAVGEPPCPTAGRSARRRAKRQQPPRRRPPRSPASPIPSPSPGRSRSHSISRRRLPPRSVAAPPHRACVRSRRSGLAVGGRVTHAGAAAQPPHPHAASSRGRTT
jgi:hypothetical protein